MLSMRLSNKSLKLITRISPLAMWQAKFIRFQLLSHYSDLTIDILGIKTAGDTHLDVSLDKIGGKGVFVKELQQAILQGDADFAVHSLKDVPAIFPEGLGLAAICEREVPFDAWICPQGFTLETIKSRSRIGTSSLRRTVQLQKFRPDLHYLPLRGNVGTRLKKCQLGEYDAIVLAVAGLSRLNLMQHVTTQFTAYQLLPAVGQGALGIECRLEDTETRALLKVLDHAPTRTCIEAERSMNLCLGGSCHVPVAGFAQLHHNELELIGRVGHPRKPILLEIKRQGFSGDPVLLGEQVAHDLIHQGALQIIADCQESSS